MPEFREIGCSGIHALTPTATGCTPWEFALDEPGDDIVIVGALDPSSVVMVEAAFQLTAQLRKQSV